MSDPWYAELPSLCASARKVARQYATYQEAWDASERGDWLLFRAAHGKNLSDEAFLACAQACLVCVIEDCPVSAQGYIRNERTEAWTTQNRLDVAVVATRPYEHGPLAAKVKTWARLADVVRSHFPEPPELLL